jgi:hypothetical protein
MIGNRSDRHVVNNSRLRFEHWQEKPSGPLKDVIVLVLDIKPELSNEASDACIQELSDISDKEVPEFKSKVLVNKEFVETDVQLQRAETYKRLEIIQNLFAGNPLARSPNPA